MTLAVSRLTSRNTGTQPCCRMGATVVGKPAATVMTSSPGTQRAVDLRAGQRGEGDQVGARAGVDDHGVPHAHVVGPARARMPRPCGPSVSQKSSTESTAVTISFSSKTRPAYGTLLARAETALFACRA